MIFILHGDDFSKSRDNILKIAKKLKSANKKEVSILDITPNELKEMCMSFDIFSEPPFVVLNVSGVGRKNLSEYIEVLKNVPSETYVVILSNKELPKSNAIIKESEKLNAKILKSNTIPGSNIFKFIDALFYNNRAQTYKELRKLMIEEVDPFYLFSMITYGLRNIALVKFSSPALEKMAPFVKGKALKQADIYTPKRIKKIYGSVYNTDKMLKTGKIAPDMAIPYIIEKVLN